MDTKREREQATPVELFRAGCMALKKGVERRARPLLVEAMVRLDAPVGVTLLQGLDCQGEAVCWDTALEAARLAAASAELAHDLGNGVGGLSALRVAVHARLVQCELLLQLGRPGESDPVLDQTFALMRGVDDPGMKASLWWTAANVARSHGRSPTEALALRRARQTGALGDVDGPELQLSFAEACLEAGWKDQAVAAVRELDGANLSRRDVGRLLGLRGALVVDRDPEQAFASWARAERRFLKSEAWRPLARLKLRMARAAVEHGVRDPIPLLLDALDERYVRALPDLPRHVVVLVARLATMRELHDVALLAEIEVERYDADHEQGWRRQAKLLSAMGFPAEAGDLMAMDRSPEVPRLPGDSFPPTANVSRTLSGRDGVARGCRVRCHLTQADLGSAHGLRMLVERLQRGHSVSRVLRDSF